MELLFSKAKQQETEIDYKALLIKQQQQIIDLQQQVINLVTQNNQLLLALQKNQPPAPPVQPPPPSAVQDSVAPVPVKNHPIPSSPPVAKDPSIPRIQYMLEQSCRVKRKRAATFAMQAQLLSLLNQHPNTGFSPAILFSQCGIASRTGYRYMASFRKKGWLAFTGPKQSGRYILTSSGIQHIAQA